MIKILILLVSNTFGHAINSIGERKRALKRTHLTLVMVISGMYGKSWGGFNGLQVAARQPSALKTIISADSTDDRYADDIHYRGGCVLAREMLSWAHIMFLWNARPPYPESMGPR